MRRFRFAGAKSKGDQPVPEAPRQDPGPPPAPGGEQPGGPPPAQGGQQPGGWESGGIQSEEPTGQQPTPSDQPAPIESGSGAQQWIPREQSGGQQPAEGEPQAAAEGETGTPAQPEYASRGQAEAGSDAEPQGEAETSDEADSGQRSESRVSVVDEPQSRPAPPPGASEEEYKWHTYKQYPSGRPDAVEFIDMYKAFGRNKILRGLNMGLPEGMVSMILGPSGTGKSVCIKHMVGLLYPDDGDVLVHGESVPNMPDDDLFEMRKKFGLLFQDGALFGSMNVFDNTAFPLRQHTEKSEDEIEDIVTRRLNEVGLGSAADRLPNELSGGMRKRAGFARALVLEPDIVLFDEPDSGLDPVRTALLGELILEIHRDMMDDAKEKQKEHLPTFSVITHDIMSARRVADYINVLWKGRIVEAGPAEDMLNSDNPFIRQFLSGESQGPLTMD
jgi:phospholipid/cholesterol/gamma-HCH transport system ATP-binding protein